MLGPGPTNGTQVRPGTLSKLRHSQWIPLMHTCLRIARPVAGIAAVLVLLVGCVPAQMRMPDGFAATSTAFAVSGHSPRRFNEPVRFGPYAALEMREGSTFAWAIPLGSADVGRTSKPYAYTLVSTGKPPVEVQCHVRAWTAGHGAPSSRTTVDLTALAGPLLACGLRFDDGAPQALEVARSGSRFEGRLRSPWGREYAVRGINGYADTPITSPEPTGYEIIADGAPLAVVDVLNGGRVHLDSALTEEQRVYFAAAAAALLLLDPALGE